MTRRRAAAEHAAPAAAQRRRHRPARADPGVVRARTATSARSPIHGVYHGDVRHMRELTLRVRGLAVEWISVAPDGPRASCSAGCCARLDDGRPTPRCACCGSARGRRRAGRDLDGRLAGVTDPVETTLRVRLAPTSHRCTEVKAGLAAPRRVGSRPARCGVDAPFTVRSGERVVHPLRARTPTLDARATARSMARLARSRSSPAAARDGLVVARAATIRPWSCAARPARCPSGTSTQRSRATDPRARPLARRRARRPRRPAARPPRPPGRRVLRRRRAVVLHAVRPRLALGGPARAPGRRPDRGIHPARARAACRAIGTTRRRPGARQDPARAARDAARDARRGRRPAAAVLRQRRLHPPVGVPARRRVARRDARRRSAPRSCPRCGGALTGCSSTATATATASSTTSTRRARAREPGLEGLRRLDPVARRATSPRGRSRSARCRATPTRRRSRARSCSTPSARTGGDAAARDVGGVRCASALPVRGVLGRDPRGPLPGGRAGPGQAAGRHAHEQHRAPPRHRHPGPRRGAARRGPAARADDVDRVRHPHDVDRRGGLLAALLSRRQRLGARHRHHRARHGARRAARAGAARWSTGCSRRPRASATGCPSCTPAIPRPETRAPDALSGGVPPAGVVGGGGGRVRRGGARRARADAQLTTSRDRSAGEADELVEREREHGVRRAARRPDLGEGGEGLVDDRGERCGMPGRRHSADRLAGRVAHLLGRRALDAAAPEPRGERGVSTRCAPLVMTRSGSPSDQNTRLFAIAPTSTPRAAAASGAVDAASGSTTMSPGMPAARGVVDEAAAGGKVRGHPSSVLGHAGCAEALWKEKMREEKSEK